MIDQSLEIAIGKLMNQITYNGQLQNFRSSLETRKIYNNYERNYIDNQKIRDQLGADYESEESDQQSDGIFGSMSKYELKCILKENLIRQKFDEQKLSFIEPPSQSVDSENQKDLINDQIMPYQKIDHSSNIQRLKIIDERNEFITNTVNKRNWFALDFVIKQLENIIENKLKKKEQLKAQQVLQNIDSSQPSDEQVDEDY